MAAALNPRPALPADEDRRARLLDLLGSIADFIVVAAPDGRIDSLNPAGRRMLGIAADADVGALRATDYHPAATLARLMTDGLPTAVREGQWSGEGVLLGADGAEIPVAMVVVAQPSATLGELPYFTYFMRDQRARPPADQALRTSEAQFRAIFESAAVGVIVIDESCIIQKANRAFEAFLGHAPGTLVGRYAPDLSPPDDAATARERIADLRAGRCTSVTVEQRFYRADGVVRWASLAISRLPLADGVHGILGVTTDITDRRVVEATLSAERAFLAATLESLSDGVVACDATGALTVFNRATRVLHGMAGEPLAPDAWADRYALFRADGVTPLPTPEIPLLRALRGEQVRDVDMVIAPHAAPPRAIRASGQTIRDAEGALLGAVVAMRDVTASVRAEAALRDSEARYRSLVDGSPDAILVHRQGSIVYANAAADVLLRVPAGETLVGRDAFERVHPDWRAATQARVTQLATPGAVVPLLEGQFVRLDGTAVATETVASAIRYDGADAVQVVIRDITTRRDAEAARRESEALTRLCVKRTPAAVAMVDRDMRYLAVSDRWLADYGLGETDVAGRTHYELFPELPEAWKAIHQRVLAGETDRCDEAAFARPDGRTDWIRWEVVPWFTATGGVGGLIMFTEVITARKELELAVRTSEARFRAALDASSDAFFVFGVVRDAPGAVVDFSCVESNDPGGALFGMPSENPLGLGLCELFPVLRGGELVACFTGVAETGARYEGEYETQDPRTVTRWVWLQVVPLRDDAGVVASIAVSAQDISARKRAEAELRLLQQVTHALSAAPGVGGALRTALEEMCRAAQLPYGEAWVPTAPTDDGTAPALRHGPVWAVAGDPRLVAFGVVNDAYTFAPGEGMIGRAWRDRAPVMMADVTADPSQYLRAAHADAAGIRSAVAIPVLADGEVVAVLAFHTRAGEPVIDAHRVDLLATVAAQVGTVMRRKVAEATLEDERHFLASVLDSLSEHVSVCDADGRLTLINQATREAHGLPAHGPVTPDAWRACTAPSPDGASGDLPDALLPHVDALLAGADVSGSQYVVHAAGHPPRTMAANVRLLRGADGTCVGSVCAARDVTAERAAEAALRASEARLSLIYNASSDLMYLIRVSPDADGLGLSPDDYCFESVNEAYLQATGLRQDEVTGRTLGEVLPATASGAVAERFAMAAASTDTLRYDESLTLRRGPVIVETTLTPIFDEHSTCTHLLGVMRDVSVRRQAEAAVRHSEAQFRGVLETVRSIAVTLDTTGAVTFVNDALLDLTGWTRDEVLGTDWFDRFVPDSAAVRDVFRQIVTTGAGATHYENDILTRSGARRAIAWDNTLLRDASGTIVGTASVGRDTTDQRALEARLAALSEHDELTGLLNRRGFTRLATHALKSAARSHRHDAVLYIDLDRFKPINDTYGHAAGDGALRAVADVLRATVRDADFSARLGGDEFAVFAVGLGEGHGQVLASRLRAALDAHNVAATAAGRPFPIGFSVGVAELAAGDDLDAVLGRADAALYAQKLARRHGAPPA